MSESNGKTPREILFRGKHLKKWRFGNCVITECSAGISNPDTLCRFTVYPETVGQYTGLKDKNGARIFEGDIVSYHHATYNYANCLIKYEPAKAGFCLVALHDDITTDENFEKGDVMSLYIPMGDVEVIGNIHDSPELLKGGVTND